MTVPKQAESVADSSIEQKPLPGKGARLCRWIVERLLMYCFLTIIGDLRMSRLWVLYSDFNCPFCYAMHERLHERGVMPQIEWRGVQHAPHLPIPMARWHGRLLEELRDEVSMVRRLAPDLPIAVPEGKPHTGSAIALAARVIASHPAQGGELIRRFYQAFWQEGRDVSAHSVQRELLDVVGIDAAHMLGEDPDSLRLVERWDEEWRETGQSGVPLLIRPDGAILVGLAREADVERFVHGS